MEQRLTTCHGDFITFQEQYFHSFNNKLKLNYISAKPNNFSAVCCQGVPSYHNKK